jgi:hypothetical protein
MPHDALDVGYKSVRVLDHRPSHPLSLLLAVLLRLQRAPSHNARQCQRCARWLVQGSVSRVDAVRMKIEAARQTRRTR